MLEKNVSDLLVKQVNKELYSAYLYLDISNYFISKNLNGFGNWFAVQVQEELAHAQLFMTYLLNNSEQVKLEGIAGPDGEYTDFLQPLEASLEHEKFITASIYEVYEAAQNAKDFRTIQFLDWFVKEQGEEEKNADELIEKYKLFGMDGKGLYMYDAELATRVFTPPSLVL
jgi:ferritin